MKFSLIYITCKNQKEAQKIAKIIVDKKLASCANIFSEIQSYYHWQGKKIWDNESILILKTKSSKVKKIIKQVKKVHSYTTPCILAFEVKEGNKNYLEWIEETLKS